MVDYTLMEPDDDVDARIMTMMKEEGLYSMNHANSQHLCGEPIAVTIETKKAAKGRRG